LSDDDLTFDNIKNDVVLIQFKVMSDYTKLNTISFLNVPSESQDINVVNLS